MTLTIRGMSRVLCLALLLSVPKALAAEKPFIDPAPPVIVGKQSLPAPVAQPNPDAKFGAAPKALSPDAKTHDWPSFLGPTHNAVSTDTHLFDDLSKLAPVWEMAKGSGYAAPAIYDGYLILFHRVGNEEVIDCLARESGHRFWRHAYPTQYTDRYGYS